MKYARGIDDRITNLFEVIQGVTGGLLYWTLISGVSTSNLKTIRHNFINHWNSPYPPFINPQFQCIWRIVTSKSSKCLIKKSTILCVLVIKDKEAGGFDFQRIPVGKAKTEQPSVMAEKLTHVVNCILNNLLWREPHWIFASWTAETLFLYKDWKSTADAFTFIFHRCDSYNLLTI